MKLSPEAEKVLESVPQEAENPEAKNFIASLMHIHMYERTYTIFHRSKAAATIILIGWSTAATIQRWPQFEGGYCTTCDCVCASDSTSLVLGTRLQ